MDRGHVGRAEFHVAVGVDATEQHEVRTDRQESVKVTCGVELASRWVGQANDSPIDLKRDHDTHTVQYRNVPKCHDGRAFLPGEPSLIGQPQIMDISIAMTFRTGNGSCGGWSYSVWVL